MALKKTGSVMVDLAAKVPKVEKGLDNLGRMFNIFHDLEKTMKPDELAEFKDAFSVAVESRDFSRLNKLGYNVSKYTGKNLTANGQTKFRTPTKVYLRTPKQIEAASNVSKYSQRLIDESVQLSKLKNDLSLHNRFNDYVANFSAHNKPATKILPKYEDWVKSLPEIQKQKNLISDLTKELAKKKELKSISGIDDGIQAVERELLAARQELTKMSHPNALKKKWDAFVAKAPVDPGYTNAARILKYDDWVNQLPEIKAQKAVIDNLKIQIKKSETILKRKTQTVIQDDSAAYKVLDDAFIQKPKGWVGSGVDKINSAYKWLLSWNPIFQTRNAIGTTLQGISQGISPQNYWEAIKMVATKGKNNPQLYKEFADRGVVSQYGMYGAHKYSPFTKLANLSESINRTALALDGMGKGKGLVGAIANTKRVFYEYNRAYKTSFENDIMSRIFPFYDFMKGQMQFWPDELTNNPQLWVALAKAKEATLPSHLKNYPMDRPDYERNMYTFGNYGNLSFQSEDFQKNITGDWKNLYSQLTPLVKLAELVSGYNVFAGKAIADNTSGKRYEKMPYLIQRLLGYDEYSGQINPWGRYLFESLPVTQPILNAYDENKPLINAVTSIRPYDLSPEAMVIQREMKQREQERGGFWEHIKRRSLFGGGAPEANAASYSIPSTTAAIPMSEREKFIYQWAVQNKVSPDKFGEEYVYRGGPEQVMSFNNKQRWGRDRARTKRYLGTIQEGADAEYNQIIANILHDAKFNKRDKSDLEQALAEEAARHEKTRVYKVGEGQPYFGDELDMFRRTAGLTDWQIAFNQAQERKQSAASALASRWAKLIEDSPWNVSEATQIQLESARKQHAQDPDAYTADLLESKIRLILAEQDAALDKLEEKSRTAMTHILENMSKGTVNELEKIELERRAEHEKFLGSQDYQHLRITENYEAIRLAQQAIDGIYDKKRDEELAARAKKHMEFVISAAKGEAEESLKAMKGIYERGGMSIDAFYSKKASDDNKRYSNSLSSILDLMMANIRTEMNSKVKVSAMSGKTVDAGKIDETRQALLAEIDKADTSTALAAAMNKLLPRQANLHADIEWGTIEKYKKMLKALAELQAIINNQDVLPVDKLEAINTIFENISGDLSKINTKEFEEVGKTFGAQVDEWQITRKEDANKKGVDIDNWNNTLRELKRESDKTKMQIYGQQVPLGYNREAEILATTQQETDYAYAGRLGAALQSLPENIGFDAGTEVMSSTETPEQYFTRVEQQLQAHLANKEAMTTEAGEKIAAAQQILNDRYLATENNTNMHVEGMIQKRIQMASNMSGALLDIATTMYEASGRKSKEAFYVMKAIALADATIKGYQSVLAAYKSGNEISPTFGAISAGIAAGVVAAQIAGIVSTTIQGMAKGGEIKGGSGKKDDVPIMAMGGEYVMRKAAVNKYGVNFMAALNEGLIPGNISFSVPALPRSDSTKYYYASGGEVTRRQDVPFKVELKNESGTPLKASQSDVQFNGQEYIVSVLIDAMDRDVGGIRGMFGG
jgi:hypothetical protein